MCVFIRIYSSVKVTIRKWVMTDDEDPIMTKFNIVLTRFSWFVLVLNKINIDNFLLVNWIHGIIAKLSWFYCLYHCWPIADHVQVEQRWLQLNRSVSNTLTSCTFKYGKSVKYFLLSLFQQFHWTDLGLILNRSNFSDQKTFIYLYQLSKRHGTFHISKVPKSVFLPLVAPYMRQKSKISDHQIFRLVWSRLEGLSVLLLLEL